MTKLYEKLIRGQHLFGNIDKGLASATAVVTSVKTEEKTSRLLSCLDLTTLNSNDNNKNVSALAEKVRGFRHIFPSLPNVAALCVWPNYASVVNGIIAGTGVKTAVVSAAFPSSQTYREIKVIETSMAVEQGCDEIDIVMPLGYFMEGRYDMVASEIRELRDAAGNAVMKVIIESGLFSSPADIYAASIIAMDAGADFIKTSTGKSTISATPEAAWVMCRAIETFYRETGIKVGFKAAGGIATVEDALLYYQIVSMILGEEWLTPDLFRIGASRLANNILTAINGTPTEYF